ncbi:MAG TPA: FkbM family methyltransferase [Mycobacteriales bacterium]|nr:FkbM family methyltransferase [Mycobacteriales bacterium]
MSVATARLRVSHSVRRVAQTPKSFTNWPTVLSDIARGVVGQGPDTLTFSTRNGQRISCPNVPGARVPIYEIFAEDCYHLRWFLGSLADEPIQVLDIGAHVGTFACELARVHPKAVIHSFEPSPRTAEYLRRNVNQNGLADRITVFEQAVAATAGWAEFDDNGGGSGLNSLLRRDRADGATTTVRVRTATFDEVAAAAPAPPSFVKVDCEGGEYDLVYASSPESWASVQRLVIEYHAVPDQSWPELRAWFGRAGLTVVRDDPETDRLGTAWLSRTPLRAD